MTYPSLRYAALTAATAISLAACGSAQMPAAPNGGAPAYLQAGAHAARELPGAKGRPLLYVSSTWGGGIYAMTYPGGKAVGHIPEDGGPYGLCTDRKGDVYAMGIINQVIVEYAHGGIDPIATLTDEEADPEGCAVDPLSGDLAVATGSNEVQIYKHGRGSPAVYGEGGILSFFFCTYDDKGNLFVTGENGQEGFALAELSKGSSTMHPINLDASPPPGYAIQWDGKYLALEAAVASKEATIDRLSISGSSATVVSSTTLSGAAGDEVPAQFWIDAGRVAVIEGENQAVGIWKYPAGGNPLKTLDGVGSGLLIGATVSR